MVVADAHATLGEVHDPQPAVSDPLAVTPCCDPPEVATWTRPHPRTRRSLGMSAASS
jgi:hypothetical protein